MYGNLIFKYKRDIDQLFRWKRNILWAGMTVLPKSGHLVNLFQDNNMILTWIVNYLEGVLTYVTKKNNSAIQLNSLFISYIKEILWANNSGYQLWSACVLCPLPMITKVDTTTWSTPWMQCMMEKKISSKNSVAKYLYIWMGEGNPTLTHNQ